MVEESQEPASGAGLARLDLDRGSRIVLYVVIVGAVFLGYGVPVLGVAFSAVAPTVVLAARREFWNVGLRLPGAALRAVLTWLGLWLPAIISFFTPWYSYLTESDHSTSWLLLPLAGPVPFYVGTLVPALAAAVVFAVGFKVSLVIDRPWLVIVGAWLAPWAHQLAFTAVVTDMSG